MLPPGAEVFYRCGSVGGEDSEVRCGIVIAVDGDTCVVCRLAPGQTGTEIIFKRGDGPQRVLFDKVRCAHLSVASSVPEDVSHGVPRFNLYFD